MREPVPIHRIVVEARELFREYGYEGASMRDLADRVGLRPQSLYTRFPSKESLVREVLAMTLDDTLAGLPDPATDWRAAWRTLIKRIAGTFEARGRCVGLHLAYGVTAQTPDARDAVRAFFARLRDAMAGILEAGKISEPVSVATDTLAQLEGATLWITTEGDMEPLRHAVERALRIGDQEGRAV
ncbi:tetR family transcriptional regulator [Acetobacter aceti NRIC 0242]|uniref:TetR family transcriptional regulator n=1 Tax=Acetobacter aceti NBRC 14818 TaxID=887700 RepID=A0AB33IHN5_ACEAC|nr:TetR/AcrR family transcriptional regulator [Acetobacter aceti]TCS31137.1 TetR family transcriptional regulator [Acetobacter aceti NBRC 14818]BCK76652.1 TetR family transcriptional regulator [Acetobacter aceti NBRC 14818]GAN58188.1 transcriptional regulator TetR [Acetobacter aceti NBRC 14818]GBO82226.1 tetR family transcriptional regulator [Acetobacter aceti NRIC 0242]